MLALTGPSCRSLAIMLLLHPGKMEHMIAGTAQLPVNFSIACAPPLAFIQEYDPLDHGAVPRDFQKFMLPAAHSGKRLRSVSASAGAGGAGACMRKVACRRDLC